MPLFTVSQGGPEIEPGVYQVQLDKVEGPKTIVPQSGPNAGQEVEIFDWVFIVEAGAYANTPIQATTSTSSGPRSKLYAFLTALFGGRPPAVGASFEAADLVGRSALATVTITESGWPRISNLGALPTPAAVPPPTAIAQRQSAAVRQPAQRYAQPAAATGGEKPLPF
jgi:hypothetical protein